MEATSSRSAGNIAARRGKAPPSPLGKASGSSSLVAELRAQADGLRSQTRHSQAKSSGRSSEDMATDRSFQDVPDAFVRQVEEERLERKADVARLRKDLEVQRAAEGSLANMLQELLSPFKVASQSPISAAGPPLARMAAAAAQTSPQAIPDPVALAKVMASDGEKSCSSQVASGCGSSGIAAFETTPIPATGVQSTAATDGLRSEFSMELHGSQEQRLLAVEAATEDLRARLNGIYNKLSEIQQAQLSEIALLQEAARPDAVFALQPQTPAAPDATVKDLQSNMAEFGEKLDALDIEAKRSCDEISELRLALEVLVHNKVSVKTEVSELSEALNAERAERQRIIDELARRGSSAEAAAKAATESIEIAHQRFQAEITALKGELWKRIEGTHHFAEEPVSTNCNAPVLVARTSSSPPMECTSQHSLGLADYAVEAIHHPKVPACSSTAGPTPCRSISAINNGAINGGRSVSPGRPPPQTLQRITPASMAVNVSGVASGIARVDVPVRVSVSTPLSSNSSVSLLTEPSALGPPVVRRSSSTGALLRNPCKSIQQVPAVCSSMQDCNTLPFRI